MLRKKIIVFVILFFVCAILFLIFFNRGVDQGGATAFRIRVAHGQVRIVNAAAEAYTYKHGRHPESLNVLITEGFIERSESIDILGAPFFYDKASQKFFSAGPDKVVGTKDDVGLK